MMKHTEPTSVCENDTCSFDSVVRFVDEREWRDGVAVPSIFWVSTSTSSDVCGDVLIIHSLYSLSISLHTPDIDRKFLRLSISLSLSPSPFSSVSALLQRTHTHYRAPFRAESDHCWRALRQLIDHYYYYSNISTVTPPNREAQRGWRKNGVDR